MQELAKGTTKSDIKEDRKFEKENVEEYLGNNIENYQNPKINKTII